MYPWIKSTELDCLHISHEVGEFPGDLIATLLRPLLHLQLSDVGRKRGDAVACVFIVHRTPNIVSFLVKVVNVVVILVIAVFKVLVQ